MGKPMKCSEWPHEYDAKACGLDREQYKRETRRRQTTVEQREAMRLAAHTAASNLPGPVAAAVDAAEDAADEGG